MALDDSYTTLYYLIGGNDPMERGTFESMIAPLIRDAFKAFDHSTVSVLTPNWQGQQDADGNFLGFDTSSTILAGHVSAATPWEYVTGIVWNLYNKNMPPNLSAMRTALYGGMRPALEEAGYEVLQTALQPYGTLGPAVGYHGWPVIPQAVLPQGAVTKPPISGGALAAGLLVAAGIIAKLQGR